MVLDLEGAVMDVSGPLALESSMQRPNQLGALVITVGVQGQRPPRVSS